MSNKHILITGASGFVGNRLAERFSLSSGYSVTALAHRYSGPGMARLARLPVNIVVADVCNYGALKKVIDRCDVIIHLAYGTSGTAEEKIRTTVTGTENILRLAIEKKVKKIIHFSTAAVHGINPSMSLVDESAPFEKSNDPYRTGKIEAEKIVWRYHKEHGLPVVVLRPPIIFGPYGTYWTARIVQEIKEGAIFPAEKGIANLVYVDNLIDAVMLAMDNTRADGEAFIVVDDYNVTWQELFEQYAEMLSDHATVQYVTAGEIEKLRKSAYPNDLKSWIIEPVFLIPEMIKTSLRSQEFRAKMMKVPWLRLIKNKFSRNTLNKLKDGGSAQYLANTNSKPKLPDEDLLKLYTSRARFSNEKIKRVLGYRQRIDFDEAIKLIADWLRYQRII